MPFLDISTDVQLYYEVSHCQPSSTRRSVDERSLSREREEQEDARRDLGEEEDRDDEDKSDEGGEGESHPWLLILHPLYQDGYCIKRVTNHPAIRSTFNRIVFDIRHHGRSQSCVPRPTIDIYSLAADLAIGLDKLGLPPVHTLATHPWSSEILLRLSAVFREKILSVCVCSTPAKKDDDFKKRAFTECFQYWAYPELAEDWDEAISSVQWWHFGPPSHFDVDILDEWAGILLKRFPPSKAVDQVMVAMPYLKRDTFPPSVAQLIDQPVLFIRGGSDTAYTHAETLARLKDLPPNPHHMIRTIPGAPLQLTRTNPNETVREYLNWIKPILEEQKRSRTSITKTTTTKKTRSGEQEEEEEQGTQGMKNLSITKKIDIRATKYEELDWRECLARLSRIANDQSIKDRDPKEPNSYYSVDADSINTISELLVQLEEREKIAFSFIGGGAPEIWTGAEFSEVFPWRFSSRFEDARMAHSTSSRNDSLSVFLVQEDTVEATDIDWDLSPINNQTEMSFQNQNCINDQEELLVGLLKKEEEERQKGSQDQPDCCHEKS